MSSRRLKSLVGGLFFGWMLFALSNPCVADEKKQKATFGGGCYWCVEAVFQRVKGVNNIEPGFMGGSRRNPSYQQVLTGRTGHAEVIHFEYDPTVISYEELLQIFWSSHDPTTKNRQGPDVGTQYRSIVFYHSDDQRDVANEYKKMLNQRNELGAPVVTRIQPARDFYRTKEDHFDYFNRNSSAAYCVQYIVPKLEKLKKMHADKLKPAEAKKD